MPRKTVLICYMQNFMPTHKKPQQKPFKSV
nr:MAG TPA: hypothetical protein [Caudoviricetes sp.]